MQVNGKWRLEEDYGEWNNSCESSHNALSRISHLRTVFIFKDPGLLIYYGLAESLLIAVIFHLELQSRLYSEVSASTSRRPYLALDALFNRMHSH